MSVEEVMEQVLTDRALYETSGGGMTLSGGEPFYQPAFTEALLRAAKEAELNTAVETSGFCDQDVLLSVIPFVDLFLFDYKATGDLLHRQLTGVPQAPILENLRVLGEHGAKIRLRCPIIPGANDTDEHFDAIAALAEGTPGVLAVDLEPYHALGVSKAKRIGQEQPFQAAPPAGERMAAIRNRIGMKTEKAVNVFND
jgi:pyruvate formate lyase activating enzyme